MQKETKSCSAFIQKADGDAGLVAAYTAVMGNIDFGDDIITSGAFVKTIKERAGKIRVLNNHNSFSVMDAVGTIKTIQEVGRDKLPPELLAKFPDATGGLYVEIQFMLDDEISRGVFTRIKAGVIDEYSIGFEIVRQEFKTVSTNEGERRIRFINEVKLYEVSPVIFAMNNATTTVSAKSKDKAEADKQIIYLADGAKACAGCKLYGKVNEELGFCQHHKLATAAVMKCDDFDTFNKRIVRDVMGEKFALWMQGQLSEFMEMGAWLDEDKERLETMLPTLSAAFLDMLPKDMGEREIPTPVVYELPKNLPQDESESLSKAEPPEEEKALTFEERAAALIAQIQARNDLVTA